MSKRALEMPPPHGGLVATLNGQGFMNVRVDATMEAFIAFAKTSPAPVADIGAAYGVATIPALEAGATVIAFDLDARHLAILEDRAPARCRQRLRTMVGTFPEELNFDDGCIGAFLISNVVHFFSPERLQLALQCVFDWLIPEGKVFMTAASPYLAGPAFVPLHEARKRAGAPWPGYLTDVDRYGQEVWKNRFSSMLLLDPDTSSRAFRQAGFVVERSEFVARPEVPPHVRMGGREFVGVIARKP